MTQLTIVVSTPALNPTVFHQGAGMVFADDDLGSSLRWRASVDTHNVRPCGTQWNVSRPIT
jgi:hypothetical protein